MTRRILYVVTRAEAGGAQSHVLELLRAMRAAYDVVLATGEDGFLTNEARSLGITVVLLKCLRQPISPLLDISATLELMRVVKAFEPSLIHCHSSKAGIIGRAAARVAGVPAIFTVHGWAFGEGASKFRNFVAVSAEYLCSKLGGGPIITVSESDQALALRHGIASKEQVTVIRNGISDHASRAFPGREGIPTAVMVARFSEPKDHMLVVRALAATETVRVAFVGDGPSMSKVKEEVRGQGLETRVDFLGTRSDVPEILARAHLFVLATKHEGLPISILEAMRAGLPVIGTEVRGIPEQVIHGKTGFLVPSGDMEALRSKLEMLSQNPSLRAQMGAEGRRLFEREFTSSRMIDEIVKIYADVLGQERLGTVPPVLAHAAVGEIRTAKENQSAAQ